MYPTIKPKTYLYTYSCSEEELGLCQMERRALFGQNTNSKVIESPIKLDPSRSPFINGRIDVIFKAGTIDELIEQIKGMPALEPTFKVNVIDPSKYSDTPKIGYEERRQLERRVGLSIPGKANLKNPDALLAIIKVNNRWVFGYYEEAKSVWFLHQTKPHNYSTALGTRVARAVVNIAVPNPLERKVIDPCCGIGTVLVEALSMGIDIVGSDYNPLVMKGARENIAHFGYTGQVILKDIRDVTGYFDAAIIDLPYNLCSVVTDQEQLEMLQSARRFSEKLVLVTVEPIDKIIEEAGFGIVDRCDVLKGRFLRQILVCK